MKPKFWLSFLTLTIVVATTQTAQAQTYQPTNRTPVADKTLGTQVLGNGNNFDITGGLSKGQTLFHSFTDFSVPTNGQADFRNPVGNRDIITRVTGNLFSDINGLLNTNGANFLLINPNGVVFGNNAQLNVGKSFVGSTANSIDLVGGGRTITFGTNPNGDAPLLSVAPNVLFDVSRLNLGGGTRAISNFGTLQTTNPNQYIGLIGGNVNVNGGQINAPGGRVELGGLSLAGAVGLSTDGNNLRAQFPTNVGRGDVSLTNQARVDVAGSGGGDIVIDAKNINLLDKSVLIAGIKPGLGTPEAVPGDIKLNATDKVVFIGSSPGLVNNYYGGVFNNLGLNSKGKGGNVIINTGSVALRDGVAIVAATYGQGNAGDVTINAKDAVSFTGQGSGIFSTVNSGAVGKGGAISINAGSVTLRDGASIVATTYGQGNAGDVTITAKDAVSFTNSDIFSKVETSGVGKGGNININASSVLLRSGSRFEASTKGTGDAGNVTVIAKDNISLVDGAYILSSVNPLAVGNGGNITINANSFSLKNRGTLSTKTYSKGNAGNIKIDVRDAVDIIGTATFAINGKYTSSGEATIDSSTVSRSVGNGGEITINAGSLSLRNGGQIDSISDGYGNAGNIKVTARDAISLENALSSIIARLTANGIGRGGNITIEAPSISLLNSSQIVTSTTGRGNAGTIQVNATDLLNISGGIYKSSQTGLFASDGNFTPNGRTFTSNAGDIIINSPFINLNRGTITAKSYSNGGNINIGSSTTKSNQTQLLLLRGGSQISTNSNSTAKNSNGGNITINSSVIVATPGNNDITANANQGRGGQVKITSQGLFGIQYRPKGQSSLRTNDFGIQYGPEEQPSFPTNDITASSTFGRDGAVNINTPGIDPGKDSTELPRAPIDASNQISQVCSTSNRQNKLTVTGRGGLPPTANDPLTGDVVWQDARAVNSQPVASNATIDPVQMVPPAVGWVFEGKGKVTLVAASTQGQPTGTSVACPIATK